MGKVVKVRLNNNMPSYAGFPHDFLPGLYLSSIRVFMGVQSIILSN